MGPSVPGVLPALGGTLAGIWFVISIFLGVVKFIALIFSTGAPAFLAWLLGAVGYGAGGILTAVFVAIAFMILIASYISDRCLSASGGPARCVSGVVIGAVHSFNSPSDDLFPFTAMHDRIDLVVKEQYFPVVEHSGAFVFCTDAVPSRVSPIMRCYYYSEEVCHAADGSLYGAIAGGVGGIIAAAIITAAIGCTTPIGCILVLALIAIVATVLVIVGALIGGQAGRASSHDTSPMSDMGNVLREGDYVTVQGNMIKRDYDEGANVLWWETSTQPHGHSTVTATPFNHCDIEADNFGNEMDGCPP